MTLSKLGLAGFGLILFGLSSCGSESKGDNDGQTGGNANVSVGGDASVAGAGGQSANVGVGGSSFDIGFGGSTETSMGGSLATWPPTGFVNVTDVSIGAYALGPELTGENVTFPDVCAGLFGVVRDFMRGSQEGGHPDFDTAPVQDVKGIVATTLGADAKPVYANPDATVVGIQSQATFDQWYRDVPGVNRPFLLAWKLETSADGVSTFSAAKNNGGGLPDSSFFPLDGQGFGDEGQDHNFGFTTEIHTSFTYNGGETFTFKGDDDVWVFINDQLVIDLGGRHSQETGTIQTDTLGLTPGQVYNLAVFHAERHTTESNFQFQTTLAFTDCGQIDGVIILK